MVTRMVIHMAMATVTAILTVTNTTTSQAAANALTLLLPGQFLAGVRQEAASVLEFVLIDYVDHGLRALRGGD